MPAETHQFRDRFDTGTVLEFLAVAVGVDPDTAAGARLADLGLHDELSILDLWSLVVEEFAERTVGDLELEGVPDALGELAGVFHRALE